MAENSTSFHTICRLLLKELRIERGVTQAHISQLLGRASTSSWSKVESGETPLTLDHILTVCTACQVWPSALFLTAQNYMSLFTQAPYSWYVAAHGSTLEKEDDVLGIAAEQYYAISSSSKVPNVGRFQVLQTPWPYQGIYAPLDVFRWILDPHWREEQERYMKNIGKLK